MKHEPECAMVKHQRECREDAIKARAIDGEAWPMLMLLRPGKAECDCKRPTTQAKEQK